MSQSRGIKDKGRVHTLSDLRSLPVGQILSNFRVTRDLSGMLLDAEKPLNQTRGAGGGEMKKERVFEFGEI